MNNINLGASFERLKERNNFIQKVSDFKKEQPENYISFTGLTESEQILFDAAGLEPDNGAFCD